MLASKSAAELLLSLADAGLVVFAAIIVMGLIGEYVVEKAKERWLPLRPRAKWWMWLSRKTTAWNWLLIWSAVVIAGVAGELISDALVWQASTTIDEISDQQIAPRSINPENRRLIAQDLAQFSGRAVRVSSYALDVESAVLADMIAASLGEAHLVVLNMRLCFSAIGNLSVGVFITGPDTELVSGLLKAFTAHGLHVNATAPVPPVGMACAEPPNVPHIGATIFVGVKPIK